MCTFFLLHNASTFYILPTLKGLACVYDASSASERDPTVVDKKPLKKHLVLKTSLLLGC